MSETNKKYQKILKELKENIKDEKQLEYVNKKFAEVSIIFLDMIDEISENFETRLHELEEQQVFVEGKLKNIQSVVKNILDIVQIRVVGVLFYLPMDNQHSQVFLILNHKQVQAVYFFLQ